MLFRRIRLVASTDPVAVDAWVAKAFWNLEVDALLDLKFACNPGFGTYEFEEFQLEQQCRRQKLHRAAWSRNQAARCF